MNGFKLKSVMIKLDLWKNSSGSCVEDWERRRNRAGDKGGAREVREVFPLGSRRKSFKEGSSQFCHFLL